MDDKKLSDHEIIKEASERYRDSETYFRQNKADAIDDLAFLKGDTQWPEAEKQKRIDSDRPLITINKMPAFVDRVVGEFKTKKTCIHLVSTSSITDSQSKKDAETKEGLIRGIENNSNAVDIYSTASKQMIECGFGALRILTDYISPTSFDQEIKIELITNPLSVSWDSAAEKYDRSDANYGFITSYIQREIFEATYPDASPSDWSSEELTPLELSWDTRDTVRVVEYWSKETAPETLYQTVSGEVTTKKPTLKSEIVNQRTIQNTTLNYYKLTANTVLEHSVFPIAEIPIVPFFGKEININGQSYIRGLFRHAKDAQRMYNYFRTTSTEILSSIPKAPVTLTATQIEGYEDIWTKAHDESVPYLLYNPDPESPAPPMRMPPPQIPSGILQEAMNYSDDIKSVIGLHDASLGARSNETSGRAIIARQREGDIGTYGFMDNADKSIKRTGEIILKLIPYIYDTEREVSIIGTDEKESTTVINEVEGVNPLTNKTIYKNDMTKGSHNIVVRTGASYATQRQEAAESMGLFIQSFPDAAPFIADLIAKANDWPYSDTIAKRLEAMVPPEALAKTQDQEEPNPQQQQMQQAQEQQMQMQQQQMEMELKMKEMELQLKELEVVKEKLEIQKKEFEIENEDLQNDLIDAKVDTEEAKTASILSPKPDAQKSVQTKSATKGDKKDKK